MKTRNGFVSNSSSSSFCLAKKNLTELQISIIKNHIEFHEIIKYSVPRAVYFQELDGYDWTEHDEWHIKEDEESLTGHTTMANFDMDEIFKFIGIPACCKY
jgi:hypothetical protein